jgi:predicted RNA binding protein YcfA (HicA-like mRNA interferase family)
MSQLTPVKRRRFEKFLREAGCTLKRIKGDHLVYDRSDLKRPVIITADKEMPIFIIRNNLKTLGISTEEYLNILRKI